MKSFRGMVRTVCDLRGDRRQADRLACRRAACRWGHGADTAGADKLVAKLAGEDGIARVQLWTAAAQQTKADTAEMKSRGKDQLIAGALIIECVRRSDADRVAADLAANGPPPELGISGASALGVYSLLCIYQKA